MKNYQSCKELVLSLLKQRAGPFSPIKKIFEPHLKFIEDQTGLHNGKLYELIFNAVHEKIGRGKCEVCQSETKLYPARGGWAKFCSKACMNSSSSSRHLNSEKTKLLRGTGIGSVQTRAKAENTYFEVLGVKNPSMAKEVQDKRKKTFLNKYGVSCALEIESVKSKISDTMQNRYGGTGNASTVLSKRISSSRRNNILEKARLSLPEWEILDQQLGKLHEHKLSLKHSCGYKIEKFMWTGQPSFNPLCPKCHGSSKEQRKVVDFLTQLDLQVLVNDRSIIKPLELDIILPNEKLAIEINGLFFHGERYGKDSKYHLNKTESAASKGFRVLHFSDFEINNRWLAVQGSIKSKLGLLEKLHARNCDVREIDSKLSSTFLNQHHLQGSCRSSTQLGLFEFETLVAVMTFGRARFNKSFDFELLRFAASKSIRGGAGKMLNKFRQKHVGKTLISYADRRWSNGAMYEALGFSRIGESKPGYWYYKDGILNHRTKFQRHKLNDQSELSESEVMRGRGYDKIWDCGNLKFKLSL